MTIEELFEYYDSPEKIIIACNEECETVNAVRELYHIGANCNGTKYASMTLEENRMIDSWNFPMVIGENFNIEFRCEYQDLRHEPGTGEIYIEYSDFIKMCSEAEVEDEISVSSDDMFDFIGVCL